MAFFGGTSTSTTTTAPAAEKDIEIADPPADSISSLAFSPAVDYLAAGSWDNNVSISSATSVNSSLTIPN